MAERFKHQAEIFEKTKDMPAYALTWEVRVGKTYPMLDTAKHLWESGKIDAIFIWTKNGNHSKWAFKHIPSYLTEMDCNTKDHHVFCWQSDKSGTRQYAKAVEDAEKFNGILWVCVNFEALPLDRVENWLEKLTHKRKGIFLIIDEAHRLKTPSAHATRAALRLAPRALFRRTLTGSPAPKGPFDLWSQYQLLDPKILDERFVPFKRRYGIFKRVKFSGPFFDMLDKTKGNGGYQNLDQLYKKLEPYTSRLLQKDVFKDLPAEIAYTKTFELSPKQKKAYDELKNEYLTVLDSGETISTTEAIVIIMRLQQISRGFVGFSDGSTVDIGGPYPSLECLDDILDEIFFDFRLNRKVTIWCRFTEDVNLILKHLAKAGYGEFVRYDGQVPVAQREINVDRLQQDPNVRGLVGNPAVGTEGQDMTAACARIYYSYSYNLLERDQSFGRIQGVNQKEKSLSTYNIAAEGSVDFEILKNLKEKTDLASIITGDRLREILKK